MFDRSERIFYNAAQVDNDKFLRRKGGSKMRKALTLSLVLLISIGFFAFAEGQAEQETIELSWAHIYEPELPYHKEAEWAAEEIAERTDGKYNIEVFPAAQLGNESDIVEGLDTGTADIIYAGAGFLSGTYGPIAIAEAPMVFRDFDHWMAFSDSDVMDELADGYRDETGHEIIVPLYYGTRHVSSNTPIEGPEDLEGLDIRVPNAPIYLMFFDNAVDANPTPIAFQEVYLSLQQGVVDAQENPLPTIRAMDFYEVQDYINLTGHMVNTLMTIVRGDLWEEMPEEDREIFREVIREASVRSSESIYEQELELADWFEEQGLTIIEPDREALREMVEPEWTGSDATWTEDQLNALLELAE